MPPAADVLLEGFHAVKHALRFAPSLVGAVRVRDEAQVRGLAARLAPDVLDALLDRAVPGPDVRHHTGVEGSALRPAEDRSVLRARTGVLVLLDTPRSPGNAGAVVRVAAAAGAGGVAVTGPLDPWGPGVLRGAAGLHYALPVLRAVPHEVDGPVVVLDAGGDSRAVLPPGCVLVAGGERAGVGAAWRARADVVLALPMRPGVSSLNLATSVAAALYRGPG